MLCETGDSDPTGSFSLTASPVHVHAARGRSVGGLPPGSSTLAPFLSAWSSGVPSPQVFRPSCLGCILDCMLHHQEKLFIEVACCFVDFCIVANIE